MSEEVTLDEFGGSGEMNQELFGLGQIPSDWGIESLSDIAKIIPGNSPPSSTYNDDGEGLPFFQGNSNFGHFHPEVDTWCSEPRKEAQPNDVLISIRAPVGDLNIANTKSCIGRGLAAIRPKSLNGLYLYYNLEERKIWLSRLATGSTFKAINKSDLELLDVPTPPLPEQRKIATVLYTVDRAIEKAEKIREQVKQSKKAVAQDLIHTGIGEQETKNAWMGEIPAYWDIRDFSEIIELSRNGIYKDEDSYGGPYPIIKMGDIFGGVMLEEPIGESVHLDEGELEKYEAIEGDLIFARHAQAGWGAGDCTYVPDIDERAVVESNMVQVRLTDEVEPLFYAQYFNSEIGVKSIKRITTTGNIKSISQGDLMKLKVPVPPKQDQMEIAKTLSSFDDQAEHSESEMERLRRLKRSLMQDLLSGTVRTTDANIEVPDEVAQYG